MVCFIFLSVVCGTINKLFYSTILLHYFAFPLHVCVQHSGPEIKWVDGGKQLLKISTHLVSTVYTQVSYKANKIRESFRNNVYLFYVYTIFGEDSEAQFADLLLFCLLDTLHRFSFTSAVKISQS